MMRDPEPLTHPPAAADAAVHPDVGVPPGARVPGGRPTVTRGRRLLHWLLILLVLALIGWLIWRMFSTEPKKQPPPAPAQVTTAPVRSADFDVYTAGVGTVTPNVSVTVRSRVDGELQRLGYTEGQDVKAGQLIAQLDPRPFQAQLAQVTAQKARDEAQLANARRDLARYNELIKDEATSQQQLDTQKATVDQLAAAVKTDEAQIRYAQTQLDYTTITAPISGRTGLRLVDVGNIVHAADTNGLVVIDQIDPITVVFTLPDGVFPQVNDAMRQAARGATGTGGGALKVVAYTRDDSRPLATGRLGLVDNHIDTTSGTFQLKAVFDNANHALWPGQYVNIHLFTGRRPQALLAPAAAVQRSQSGTYVYALTPDGNAEIRPVDVALIQDGQAVLTKGVAAGDKIVVDGQYKIKPGAKVVETRGGPAAATGPTSGGSPQQPGDAKSTTTNPAQSTAPENGSGPSTKTDQR